VLGIETSCDETSAAVLRGRRDLLGHVILSQDVHALYGGVVPEIASREHLRAIDDVVTGALRQAGVALSDIDVVAATAGPGLIGALLVGLSYAKGPGVRLDRPFIAVHHMEAHLFATELEHAAAHPPFIGLLVSGGHTMLVHVPEWGRYELLGETRDDAAGEAFDKVAKLLGLGYPGGPAIEQAAAAGDSRAFRFPRPMLASTQTPADADYYDFSFSGLKTSVLTRVRELEAAASSMPGVLTLRRRFRPPSSACWWRRPCARWSRRLAGAWCWVAAWRPVPRCAVRSAAALGADGELFAPSCAWPRTMLR
jgi:N6-L-threonylcarbamoyladenine synthase